MRLLAIAALYICGSLASADETKLGLYIKGSKIGSLSYTTEETEFAGKPAKKTTSKTEMSLTLEGQAVTISENSSSWSSPNGKPLLIRSYTQSGGKWTRSEARFGLTTVAVDTNSQGHKSSKVVNIPHGTVVDDPLVLVLSGEIAIGKTKSIYAFVPTLGTFQKNIVHVIGATKTTLGGAKVDATLVEITDSSSGGVTKVFMSAKGDPLRIESPPNIVMIPEPKVAGDGSTIRHIEIPSDAPPKIDLATLTKIIPSRIIADPASLTKLKVRFVGKDLSKLPNDEHQTVTQDGKAWVVEIHPTKFGEGKTYSILSAAKDQDDWIAASMYLPSDSPKFVRLARQIIGTRTTVRTAASMIRQYVYKLMKPNAGMGILRDASDVLESKEGVCRDYAVLTTTLLRAAHIPARIVSGLVSLDGEFYYHAWAEAWDGAKWIGVDSTTDADQISAAHIKLADGNVEKAFAFLLLDNVKMEIIESSKK